MFYKEREWHLKGGRKRIYLIHVYSSWCVLESVAKEFLLLKLKVLYSMFSVVVKTHPILGLFITTHTTLLPSSPILKIGFSIFYHFSNGIYTCRIFLLYLFFFFEKKPVSRDHSHLQRNFFSLSHYLHERGSTKHPFFLNLWTFCKILSPFFSNYGKYF